MSADEEPLVPIPMAVLGNVGDTPGASSRSLLGSLEDVVYRVNRLKQELLCGVSFLKLYVQYTVYLHQYSNEKVIVIRY